MSEQTIAVTYFHQVTCDKAGCAQIEVTTVYDREDNQFSTRDGHERILAAAGWRVFASRSGRRWYCPAHSPSAGSKAYEVTSR